MTPEQRVGQLFIVGLANDRLGSAEIAAIRAQHFGSWTFIETTTMGVNGVRSVTESIEAQVSSESTANIRFFVAANQEGGRIQALRGPSFSRMPAAVEQGRLDASTLVARARRWGRQLAAGGVNLNFAPVMDVVPPGTDAQNEPIGVLQREFGHDPATVGSHGVAFLTGMERAGLSATAKHFPGLGRVKGNTDFTADVVDASTTPDDPYLQPFQEAIDAGVPFVMIALATYSRIDPDHLAVFLPVVMREMLRDAMSFPGVIVSDDIGDAEAVLHIPPGRRATDFLSAGGDMIVSKTVRPAVQMTEAILSRAATDSAFAARVDDATARVLMAKEAAGLLPC
jgi:beta-N-acetylhexosaminidase